MKTPEHRLKVAAAGIAAKLKEGASENEIRATLFLAGANMEDVDRAFELAKAQGETTATYQMASKKDCTFKDQAADLAEYAKEQGMTTAPSFMEKLKEARKAAGLTQQTMADRMLIPKRTIEDWERGISAPAHYVQRFVLNELEQIAGDHHAIIDREAWEAAQAKMQKRKRSEQPTAPRGYKWQGEKLVIDEEDAKKVLAAFDRELRGNH